MVDVFLEGLVDMFGDPIPASRGKKGRPPHVPTAENRRFVQLSLACGKDDAVIAAALKITERTLQRHYFHELAGRASARHRLDMKNLAAIVAEVEAGNVSAMSLLNKKVERMNLADAGRIAMPSKAKPPKKGKKEAAVEAAHSAHEGTPWGNLLRH